MTIDPQLQKRLLDNLGAGNFVKTANPGDYTALGIAGSPDFGKWTDPSTGKAYTVLGNYQIKDNSSGEVISYDPNAELGKTPSAGGTPGTTTGAQVDQKQISQPGYVPGQPYTKPPTTSNPAPTYNSNDPNIDIPQNKYSVKTGQLNPAYDPNYANSTATSSPSFSLTSGNLSQGSQGTSVKQLQQLLGITTDGIFGPQTRSAVMAFQQKNGLTVDGIVGPQTAAALAKLSSGAGASSNIINPTPAQNTTTTPSNTTSLTYTDPAKALADFQSGKISATQYNTWATNFANANPSNVIAGINADANSSQNADLASILASVGNSANVDTSASEKLISSLLASLNNPSGNTSGNPANTPTLSEKLSNKRAELGVDPLETQLNTIDAQIAKLDADFSALSNTEDNRLVSVTKINQRKTQDQINYEKQKKDLITERNSIADTLNTKYAVINSYMQYASQDYNNAQQNYDNNFTKAINLINLIKGVQNDQKSTTEKAIDTAKANLTTITDALKGKTYSSLDPTTQATINKLELQAGLPSGFTKMIMDNASPAAPVVSIGSEFTNASGQRQVPIYNKDARTGVITAKVITLGTGGSSGGGGSSSSQNSDIENIISQFQAIIKKNNWYGVDPGDFQTMSDYLQKTYGTKAVSALKTAMNAVNLKVDYVGDGVGAN